jgi:hypothetical protein
MKLIRREDAPRQTREARHLLEFNDYLRACTDSQVFGVLAKETKANRAEYIALTKNELRRRKLV